MNLRHKKSNLFKVVTLGILFTILASFTAKPGGEGFQIYLNSKLIIEKYGRDLNNITTIQLDPNQSTGHLSVKYFHCGRIGKNRTIAIKDAGNKTLKLWRFPDQSTASLSSSSPGMDCNITDILSLQKNNPGRLSLYYSSSELPEGRVLAYITRAK